MSLPSRAGNLNGFSCQQIAFFYLNIARRSGRENAHIARIDVPVWAAQTPGLLDIVQQAIYQDCEGIHYPYVLIRAHELAVVSHKEKQNLEDTLRASMLRDGLLPELSTKAMLKQSF